MTSTEYAGSGDPARTLALLWREPPGRTGRSNLSVDRLVATAVAIADADGIAALSMRRLAERLGVGAMSLYTYVPGKAELLDLMIDTVIGELPLDAGPAAGDGWRPALERIARDHRDLHRRHPWMLQIATTRPPLGPNVIARYEHDLRAVDGIGLSDLEMDSVVTLVGGYVRGAAQGAVDAELAERRTGISDEQWWAASSPVLEKVFDAARYPLAARIGAVAGEAYQAPSDPAHAFEFGLQRVLDGIEMLVRARS